MSKHLLVDGIPMDNSGNGTAAGVGTANFNRADYGTGISDLNADDIESISVLKGPNAAALYGSRAANATYTYMETDSNVIIDLARNSAYIGQPTRLNGDIKGFTKNEFFSDPQDFIISGDPNSDDILSEIVMSTAEVYFLRAEAAVKGFSTSATAEELFQAGIRSAMELYNVSEGDIDLYLASSNLAILNGTDEENFEKISIQRWIASYTDGFEGWSIVRKTGYPSALSAGVEDTDIFSLGDINGDYPTRMQYGPKAYDLNGANLNEAISTQGADKQNTVLWWAK